MQETVRVLVAAVMLMEAWYVLRRGGVRSRRLAGVTFGEVGATVLALLGTLVATIVLMQVPGLDWGWWSALGGEGNVLVAAETDADAGSRLLTWALLIVLSLCVPAFAHREEELFRARSERRSTAGRARMAFLFGIVHVAMGIPIGAGLALGLGGWYFTAMYMRTWRRSGDQEAAVAASTRVHVVWNWIALFAFALALAASAGAA